MVRDYREEDFGSIAFIIRSSFPRPEPEWFTRESGIDVGKAWVYEVNGKVVGFIIGKIKHDVPYVFNVAVLKEYRKSGIASELFAAFEAYYEAFQKPENKMFWLQVEHNNPAQKLYFDLGYRVSFVEENYYGHGSHALCMYKTTRPISNVRYK